jgi:hypothetical protein
MNMQKDTEGHFFDLLRGIASLFSGLAHLLGALFGLTGDAINRSSERRKEQDGIRLLEASYDVTQLYARNAELSRAAGFPDLEGFLTHFYERLAVAVHEREIFEPVYPIRAALIGAVGSLYQEEGLGDVLPAPLTDDPVEQARYRDKLLQRISKTSNPDTLALIHRTLIDSITCFLKTLPPSTRETLDEQTNVEHFGMTIPLLDVLPHVGQSVEQLILPFYREDVSRLNVFDSLRAQLDANALKVSQIHKQQKLPSELDEREVAQLFLGDTVLHDIFQVSVPFGLPDEQRFSGHWIIAPPGRGKTTLLHSMFLDDIGRNASIIVMDSKGDLINPIKSMAEVADRLVLIEPDSLHPLALNPLDVPSENIPHTIALIEYILSGLLEAKFTNLQSALFRHVLPSMLQAFDHPTIETLKRVLADGLTKEEIGKLDDRLRAFFEDKVHGFNAKTYAETRSQIIWRLDFILTNDTMRAMFASPTTRLKLGEAMNSGKFILIDASKAKLGDDGSEFYQRFFLALILGAAQARSTLRSSEKLPVYVYLDECQWVRNDQKLATILDECRSQKIALILAHQRTDQITNPNVLSAMANCAIRFANSDDEAKFLAPKLRCDTEFLYSLPRGTFAAFVRDLTPRAIALKVPYRNIEDLPRMSAAQQAAIRQRMRDEYGFIASKLEPRAVRVEKPAEPPALILPVSKRPEPPSEDKAGPLASTDW